MASVWENFFNAAQELVVAGSVKQRLADAYTHHLAHIDTEEVPREIREEFAALGGSLSAIRPMRGETAIQATVRKMSDSQAANCALQIINLFATLARLQVQTRTPMLRAVNSGDD
jgi:hypothetical protein